MARLRRERARARAVLEIMVAVTSMPNGVDLVARALDEEKPEGKDVLGTKTMSSAAFDCGARHPPDGALAQGRLGGATPLPPVPRGLHPHGRLREGDAPAVAVARRPALVRHGRMHEGTIPVAVDVRRQALQGAAPRDLACVVALDLPTGEAVEVSPETRSLARRDGVDEGVPEALHAAKVDREVHQVEALREALADEEVNEHTTVYSKGMLRNMTVVNSGADVDDAVGLSPMHEAPPAKAPRP
eukprot:CAMPEP_0176268554 /NCGR_PEP_ID=MMETSP0121_2-20121125/43733_1 /TAXON_ID=160619 /ORGANISM="Kryptoperidinium foliaceum, Strain CCMP 1326" /LENGTH=243 /DNA_ID=CAMNT_0017608649 /DNA_START=63 /DNA_END=793 /DNA_ORIENTATION=-